MKSKLNLYCFLLIAFCLAMLVSNVTDRLIECYNLGKGVYSEMLFSNWWLATLVLWGIDMNVLLFTGIVFILIVRNIDKTIVFDWRNVKLFRVLAGLLFVHFVFSTSVNYIEQIILGAGSDISFNVYAKSIPDQPAMIATLFIFIIAEVFAIGLRLKEEQELTI